MLNTDINFTGTIRQTRLMDAIEDNKRYHALESFSASQIKVFIDDRTKWYHRFVAKDWEAEKPTPAIIFGSYVHFMLELGGPQHITVEVGEDFETFSDDKIAESASWVEEPTPKNAPPELLSAYNDDGTFEGRRGRKAYQVWKKQQVGKIVPAGTRDKISNYVDWKSQHGDKIAFTSEEFNTYAHVYNQLLKNSEANAWLKSEEKEVYFDWVDEKTSLPMRCKLDCIDNEDHRIVDWKTTRYVKPKRFSDEMHNGDYALQLAVYRRGFRANREGSGHYTTAVCAIENTGSYRIRPYDVPETWMQWGDDRLDEVLQQIKNFEWGDEEDAEMVTLSMPAYINRDRQYEV